MTTQVEEKITKSVALIVAHPDDETLWAGGTILSHPSWRCFVVCLCRKSDADRAPRFFEALKALKSEGIMGELDDGPDQKPLDDSVVEDAILELLPRDRYDLVITHNPLGEYTRHLRHEEVGKAVVLLWSAGKIAADELWTFAYEDGNREYFPRPIENASFCRLLAREIWIEKYNIITQIYGFGYNTWEAETTPRSEAFRRFTDPFEAKRLITNLKYEK